MPFFPTLQWEWVSVTTEMHISLFEIYATQKTPLFIEINLPYNAWERRFRAPLTAQLAFSSYR